MPDDLYLIRNNGMTWAKIDQVVSFELGGAGDLAINSNPYRDIFQSTVRGGSGASGIIDATVSGMLTSTENLFNFVSGAASTGEINLSGNSDEVDNVALRQTALTVTFWKFTVSGTNPPFYVEYQEGDIVADNPPQTE